MKKHLCVGIAIALAALCAGCGSSKGVNGNATKTASSSKSYHELRIGMSLFPGALNWWTNPVGGDVAIQSLATQGLVEIEPEGELKLALASSIEHPSITRYIYDLHSGVKFSDGKPLTAADVVYSLDQNLSKTSPWEGFWVANVASVSAKNGLAVEVKLKHPSASWPGILAFTDQVVEKAAAEKGGGLKTLGLPSNLPIGTGPWKIDSFAPEASAQLSRNPYWTGARQPASKISVTLFKTESEMALALRSGGIDGALDYEDAPLFASVPSTHVETGPENWISFLAMNTANAPFNNIHVRRAVADAIDTASIVHTLYHGSGSAVGATVAQTMITPSAFSAFQASEVSAMLASVPRHETNLAKAKQELAKSPYPHGFSTEVQVSDTEQLLISAAQIISADLAKIGINANVHELATGEYASLAGKRIKLWIQEDGLLYPDPDGLLYLFNPAFIAPVGGNDAEYNNPEVTKLLTEEAVESSSSSKRLQMIGKILRTAEGEVPNLPLFTRSSFFNLTDKYVATKWSFNTEFFTPWAMNVKLAG